ncbi:SgcJ/EcaC family oxidoreductase [Aestuariivita boseongensis]|uniref:SgcJ/EcaC family oxidoreductase n=1 Tax=Aestuariivita boseongensis TaxID=1470562 RepID=UPI0006813E8C|nr:SgcJ/EcaC family oxidoreductase [Aestuariivita boseongensis]
MGVASPEGFPQAFTDAWMARDGAALAGLFAEDADFINVVGIWWEDRAAIARAHSYALESFFAKTRLVPGRVKTRMLGQDAAVVQCRFRLSGQIAPDGSEAGARSTIITFVLERVEAGWQAVSAQNTDIVPGAETQLNDKALRPADYR